MDAKNKAALEALKAPYTAADEPAGYVPPGEETKFDGPLPNRDNLLISAWLQRELPPRDYLLGEVISTTSRCLLIGETGVGKTLLALELAGAIAAGADVLGWEGRRPARVMYLDGELPAETFKDRMELIAAQYGCDIDLYGYNRDVLTLDDMPPLNTEAGQKWLWREIEAVRPDIIFLDAIMCLLGGTMSEEESWAPVKALCRQISARRIAQVWLHHTGHDVTKGFGTKTREWEMDIVIMLLKLDEDEADESMDAAFQIEFKKARNRTARNFKQFATRTVRRLDQGFITIDTVAPKPPDKSEAASVKHALEEAYERLADCVEKADGFDGKPVKKVAVEALRNEMKSRGFLDVSNKDQITATGRTQFRRAKIALIGSKNFVQAGEMFWRIR